MYSVARGLPLASPPEKKTGDKSANLPRLPILNERRTLEINITLLKMNVNTVESNFQ